MKRVSLSLFFALICTLGALPTLSAQNTPPRTVQPFEGEAGLGMIVNAERNLHNSLGYSLFVEGRHNFRNSGWDIGAQLFTGHGVINHGLMEDGGPNPYIEHIKPLTFSVLGDYNFRASRSVSLFIGHGPGLTYMMDHRRFSSNHFLTFSTRFGVELFHSYRLTFDWKIFGDRNKIIAINLGYVFGGRPK